MIRHAPLHMGEWVPQAKVFAGMGRTDEAVQKYCGILVRTPENALSPAGLADLFKQAAPAGGA